MGKHDDTGHTLHIPKKDKFVQPKPPAREGSIKAAHAPRPGRSAYNMYK